MTAKNIIFTILLAMCAIGATFFLGALLAPEYAKLGLVASIVLAAALGLGYLLGNPKHKKES